MVVAAFVCASIDVSAYSKARRIEPMFATFDEMQQANLEPDVTTYAILLNGCSHGALSSRSHCLILLLLAAGLVDKARDMLRQLGAQGLEPNEIIHAAMVDVLARANQLREAEDYLLAHIPRSESGHTALLGGCRTHGDVERAERVLERAASLPGFCEQPDGRASGIGQHSRAALFSLMSDIYSRTGRHREATALSQRRALSVTAANRE